MQSVLITGCSEGGIGFSLAEEFLSRGLTVFATARDVSKMGQLGQHANAIPLELDVTGMSSINSAVAAVRKHTGGSLTYLVNNSGIGLVAPILETNIEEAKAMFDVNLWGVLRVAKAFLPLLLEANGTMVNICSVAGVINIPWAGAYCASKAAETALGDVLRLELEPFGVKVISVMAGFVRSKLAQNALPHEVSPTSIYHQFADAIKRRAGYDIPCTGSDTFAHSVVSDVLAGARGKIWRGNGASLIYYISSYMPGALKDRILASQSGL